MRSTKVRKVGRRLVQFIPCSGRHPYMPCTVRHKCLPDAYAIRGVLGWWLAISGEGFFRGLYIELGHLRSGLSDIRRNQISMDDHKRKRERMVR